MTTKTDETTTDETKVETKTENATPPKVETKTAPEAKADAKSGEPAQKRARVTGNDEEIPDDADLIELTPAALKKRLDRHASKELKARFGTDDVDSIKKQIARAAELEKKEEETKRAAMTEAEKLRADLKKETDKRVAAEERYNTHVLQNAIEKQETRVSTLASKHLKPKYIRGDFFHDFAMWLKDEFKDDELAKVSDAKLDKFFVGYLKENPEFAKDFKSSDKTDETAEGAEGAGTMTVEKVPLNNGAKVNASGTKTKSGAAGTKDFSPRAANAMTRGEARAEAAKRGINWS